VEIPKLIECSQVLAQLSESFSALPEAQQKGVQAAISHAAREPLHRGAGEASHRRQGTLRRHAGHGEG